MAFGPFAPRLLPLGLFDDDEEDERWAVHPNFPPSQLLVSNMGALRTPGRHGNEGEYDKAMGTLRADGYRSKSVNGKSYQVHDLVCNVWHGPKPLFEHHSPDHIQKYNDDFVRERSDNRANNLYWATRKQQRANQKTSRARADGKPIYGRQKGQVDSSEWHLYTSAWAAGKELGLDPSRVSQVCRGKGLQVGGYEFKYAPSGESQTDLPPLPGKDINSEKWREAPNNESRLWVSSRGRVQSKNANGGGFSPKRTPVPAYGVPYAYVKYQGKSRGLHIVIWMTFHPNDPPINDESIDHVDRNKANNALWNIRRLNESGQKYNQTKPIADDIVRPRVRICGWLDGQANTPTYFISSGAAARELNTRFQTTRFEHGNINRSARRGFLHNGWRFAYVETAAEKTTLEAQRERVCSALAALEGGHVAAEASPPPPKRARVVANDESDDESDKEWF